MTTGIGKDNRKRNQAIASYAFAAVVTAAAFLFRFELNQLTGTLIPVSLCGMAAVIACAWRAGLGPASVAVALTTAWYLRDIRMGFQQWIHWAIYAGEVAVFCVYARQLRIARDRALQGEDWRQRLVETAGEGIWMINPDGVIDYANPRIAEILGCGVTEITGRKVEDFSFPRRSPGGAYPVSKPAHRHQGAV